MLWPNGPGRVLGAGGFAAFPRRGEEGDLSRDPAGVQAALRAKTALLADRGPALRRLCRPLRRAASDLGLR